ncbi:Wound-induced protein [Musa troglodytarum]|uniref:Wound-induced protein n=1 Tax=Musa troglodytarum TaxID=320322 RepID=A0A9E7H5U2_9LILI|nr:Wound-induced protein [Musa troglodytarum]
MRYLNSVWMAASVAVVQGHANQGIKSSGHLATVAVAAAAAAAGLGVFRGLGGAGNEERRKQADDSFRKAMYLSCWGPS